MASANRKMVRIGRDPVQYDSQVSGNSDIVKGAASAVTVAGQPNAPPVQFLDGFGRNKGAATLYLMFFDAATVPANGAIPAFLSVPIPASSVGSMDMSRTVSVGGQPATYGPQMVTGLCWAASTTADTLTIDNTGSLWVTCRYA